MGKFLFFLLPITTILLHGHVAAQARYFTKTGVIRFYSKAPLEDIEAVHKTVTAVLDATTGAMQFAVHMKGFEFKKALMQQHFNENYVESDQYPRAEFKGSLTDKEAVTYTTDGTYPVVVHGRLTLHGITREIQVPGTIQVVGGRLLGRSSFTLQLSDYNIAIPALVKDKVSNTISVTVNLDLQPLKG
jgi:polyisoprenoid-binding protein YceI